MESTSMRNKQGGVVLLGFTVGFWFFATPFANPSSVRQGPMDKTSVRGAGFAALHVANQNGEATTGNSDPVLIYPTTPVLNPDAQLWCPEVQDHPDQYVLLESLAGVSPGLTLDIGAFNGDDAIKYAAAGHRVHSFEPVPNKAKAITKLFAANINAQRLTMNQVALANNSGEIQFTVNPGVGSLLDGIQTSNQAAIPGSTLVSVRVNTLDNELKKLEPNTEEIVYMKIDAQGHDGEVILGAKRLLAKHRITRLAFEVTPALSSVATYIEAFTFLHNVGYKCFDCGCQRNNNQRFWPNGINAPIQLTDLVQALNDDKFQFRGAHLGGWTNVVCLPQVF